MKTEQEIRDKVASLRALLKQWKDDSGMVLFCRQVQDKLDTFLWVLNEEATTPSVPVKPKSFRGHKSLKTHNSQLPIKTIM